jgi:predicted ATP-grasp superfamily ATP-dependent carboligase
LDSSRGGRRIDGKSQLSELDSNKDAQWSASGVALSTLVILGASITGLAVARDAHRHGLRSVVVDSSDGPGLHSRRASPVKVGAATEAATIDRILSLGGPQVALISTSDDWIRFVIEHRSVLSAAYGMIVQPENATLELCLDKMAFSEWCIASGFPCPPAWNPGSGPRPASLRFPVLLRPIRTLHGSRELDLPKAVQALNESELAHWLAQFEAKQILPLVSESLLGRSLEQYSVPFARKGIDILLFTARKVRPSAELCQTGTCVEMCVDNRVEQLARSAIERLNYFGIGEVEILRDTQTGEDYLIEINARPWLQYALAPASNHDFLGLVLGLPLAAKQRPVLTGKTWVSFRPDLFVAFSRSVGMVRHGRLSLLSYLHSIARSNVFALFDWRDLRPFLLSLRHR